jgi:hypothetical protein
MRMLALIAASLTLAACAPAGTGERVTLPDGAQALTWGDGAYGVVLLHDGDGDAAAWEKAVEAIGVGGMTMLAPETVDAATLLAAIAYLHDERGLERVAVLAAGAAADAAFAVGADAPRQIDQLIVISARGDAATVAGLGEFPKLFAASEDEAAAADATAMAGASPGLWNALYLASGGGSGLDIFTGNSREDLADAILRRLEERR